MKIYNALLTSVLLAITISCKKNVEDETVPVVEILNYTSEIKNGKGENITVFQAADAGGFSSIRYELKPIINFQLPDTVFDGSYTVVADLLPLKSFLDTVAAVESNTPAGFYIFSIEAGDNHGNVSEAAVDHFFVVQQKSTEIHLQNSFITADSLFFDGNITSSDTLKMMGLYFFKPQELILQQQLNLSTINISLDTLNTSKSFDFESYTEWGIWVYSENGDFVVRSI